MTPHWEKDFFRDVALDFWRTIIPPEMTRADVDFLERALQPAPGAPLLDVPCGQGRHAVALAERGYCLTGVDQSAECIAEARASGLPQCEWHCQDMRDLPWSGVFGGAYCFGNSFAYLDADGARVFLKAVCDSLQPGARFAMETGAAAESLLPKLQTNRWMASGGIYMLSNASYDAGNSRLDIDYTFLRDGRAETRPSSSYVHTVAELRRMFRESGFAVELIAGSAAGEPYTLGSPRLLMVGRKA